MDGIVLSVVVPCYNEKECIERTHARLTDVLRGLAESYEIVYVNDGSRDGTDALLSVIARSDACARVLHLSANRGHQVAVTAGIDHARGDAVVIIDADLQDPPEVIPEMVAAWRAGAQVVVGQRRSHTGISWFKRMTAKLYYKILFRLTDGMVTRDVGDFRLVDRRVVDAVRTMGEHHRFLRGMFCYVGFAQTAVLYDRDARFAGRTHYSLKRMLALALDGIFGFSDAPARALLYLGALLFVAGNLGLLACLIAALSGARAEFWALAALGVTLCGVTLLGLSVVGQYLCRIYDEARARPLYFVAREEGALASPPPVYQQGGTKQ